jgi:hypothetical protein
MDGTPQPIVPDVVEPLGHHLRENAAHELQRRQGHGLPALVLRLLLAEAAGTSLDREPPAIGQRAPGHLPAHVVQHPRRALPGRLAVDDPPRGPHGLRSAQVRPCLPHPRPTHPAAERREGVDGHQRGPAGGLPRGAIGGDPAGGHEAVHVWRVGEGTAPGVPPTAAPEPPPDIRRLGREFAERLGRGAEHAVVQVLLRPPDELPSLLGHGEDHMKIGDR